MGLWVSVDVGVFGRVIYVEIAVQPSDQSPASFHMLAMYIKMEWNLNYLAAIVLLKALPSERSGFLSS